MTISKDRVKPSPLPDCWKLSEIFATGVVLGAYLALTTVLFFYVAYKTEFFVHTSKPFFKLRTFNRNKLDLSNNEELFYTMEMLASAVYLQVSTISQALIFVTRSRGFSFFERPGLLLVSAFIVAQLIASVIAAEANWNFAGIRGIGWKWTAVVWVYNIVIYLFLDPIKIGVRYALSGKAWNLILDKRMAFTSQQDFGREAREAAWARQQRTLHGLQSAASVAFTDRGSFVDINQMAEEAKRRAEIARLRQLLTLKGRVESFAKLRGLDVEGVNLHYTL